MLPDAIVNALANLAMALDFSTDEQMDEDCVVQLLEQMAGDLSLLKPEDLASLCDGFRAASANYSMAEERQFVWNLPSALGLEVDEEDEDGNSEG